MKKNLLLLLCVFSFSFADAQTEVGGAKLPNTQTFDDATLVLNGAGVREKFWIDLYAAALYLGKKNSDAKAIVNSEEPMAIKLHIVSGMISSDKLIGAVRDGFDKSTGGNTAPIQPQIDSLLSHFQDEINKGDVFDLVYFPDRGVVAYKNGEERGAVKGKDFKKALFGIWLSDNPADKGLKADMLGK